MMLDAFLSAGAQICQPAVLVAMALALPVGLDRRPAAGPERAVARSPS